MDKINALSKKSTELRDSYTILRNKTLYELVDSIDTKYTNCVVDRYDCDVLCKGATKVKVAAGTKLKSCYKTSNGVNCKVDLRDDVYNKRFISDYPYVDIVIVKELAEKIYVKPI